MKTRHEPARVYYETGQGWTFKWGYYYPHSRYFERAKNSDELTPEEKELFFLDIGKE